MSRVLLLSSLSFFTSPTDKFGVAWTHFCRLWSSGRYSRTHLFQNKSAKYWTWRQRRLYWSTSSVIVGGMLNSLLNSRQSAGLKGLRSFMSSLVVVIGRLFRMHSTSHIKVLSISSLSVCSFVTARSTLRIDLICRSHIPPIWLACGGLNFHWILLLIIYSVNRTPYGLKVHSNVNTEAKRCFATHDGEIDLLYLICVYIQHFKII